MGTATGSDGWDARLVWVTGAAGGLGRACARILASRGATLLLTDVAGAPLDAVREELGDAASRADTAVCDVADASSVSAVGERLASGAPLDAVIHTAGISPTQESRWERIVEVDLVGSARVLEAALPALANGGAMVCIASMAGYIIPDDPRVSALMADPLAPDLIDRLGALPELRWGPELAYGHAKRAVRALVAREASRVGERGARLVSISPGTLDTAMGRSEIEGHAAAGAILDRTPISRLGRPEEIAELAIFLASTAASYVTGADLLADGGAVAALGLLSPQS